MTNEAETTWTIPTKGNWPLVLTVLGLTYIQAFTKAYKEVKPPTVTLPFMRYEEWKKKCNGEV
ncbi:hypothetical protein M5J14_06145 [Lysinibacillus sp. OL1_EC]|uniref:hypothetical protein n=1 Tax=unclassified Lysinibacillus TaxID=2636778 RepID=UPI00103CC362|nr:MULTISPECIES: hypothetical protein [unclassified Lysinibacillus]MCM0624103.1 hypothetical protein [Lysinibacillus sp. OL1_EC]MCS5501381.1 hypothetical protein [Lysinibacillus sp. A4]TBV88739.1 hypothetical protein EW028_04660 [Lysinibacillus sp. OL1]UKJ43562.1 hypothetical protein L6W14_12335 [Lysinibacillus sp. ACHW1.5]WGT37248.1 hypothetical protein QH639_15495 [Lysinibacillus sp. 1 U-2021]